MWIRKLFFSVLLLSCGWLQAQTVWPAVQSNMYPHIPFMKLVRHEQTVLLGEGTTTYKVRTAVETQWFELLANQASVNIFQSYVDSSVQVVNAYAEQFKIGRRSLLDVLNAENELFTARTNAMTANTDAALSAWRLLSLRGYLTDFLEL